jgi:hypothetical protein
MRMLVLSSTQAYSAEMLTLLKSKVPVCDR